MDGKMTKLQIILPHPDLLHLTVLYLEKYDLLADEDKVLCRQIIRLVVNPPMFVVSGADAAHETTIEKEWQRTRPPLRKSGRARCRAKRMTGSPNDHAHRPPDSDLSD
jgi:hypothetical protein